jgi:hypothetical protein
MILSCSVTAKEYVMADDISFFSTIRTYLSLIPPQVFFAFVALGLFFILRKMGINEMIRNTLHAGKQKKLLEVESGLQEHLLELHRILIDSYTAISTDYAASDRSKIMATTFQVQKCLNGIIGCVSPHQEFLDRGIRDEIDRFVTFMQHHIVSRVKRTAGYQEQEVEELLSEYLEASKRTRTLMNTLSHHTLRHSSPSF